MGLGISLPPENPGGFGQQQPADYQRLLTIQVNIDRSAADGAERDGDAALLAVLGKSVGRSQDSRVIFSHPWMAQIFDLGNTGNGVNPKS
jgi:hypothetical protein